jgi:hypothetical protein
MKCVAKIDEVPLLFDGIQQVICSNSQKYRSIEITKKVPVVLEVCNNYRHIEENIRHCPAKTSRLCPFKYVIRIVKLN